MNKNDIVTIEELETAKQKAVHNQLTELEWIKRSEQGYLTNLNPTRGGLTRFKVLREQAFGTFLIKFKSLVESGYELFYNYAKNVDAAAMAGFRVVLIKPVSEQEKDLEQIREGARQQYINQVSEDLKAYTALRKKAGGQLKELQIIKNRISETEKKLSKLDKNESPAMEGIENEN